MHKKLIYLMSLVFLSIASSHLYANVCTEIKEEARLNAILLNADLDIQRDRFVDCKVLPYKPTIAVIAVAIDQQNDADYGEYQLSLLAIGAETGRLIQTYSDPTVLISDAIGLSSITLDTAAYQLNKTQRAIGVRSSYVGASRVNPYHPEVLSLYNLDTQQKVLDNFVVALERGDWNGRCEGEWEEQNTILQMLNKHSNGVADIKVVTTHHSSNTQQNKNDENECDTVNEQTTKESFILKFDGQQYLIPKQYRNNYSYFN